MAEHGSDGITAIPSGTVRKPETNSLLKFEEKEFEDSLRIDKGEWPGGDLPFETSSCTGEGAAEGHTGEKEYAYDWPDEDTLSDTDEHSDKVEHSDLSRPGISQPHTQQQGAFVPARVTESKTPLTLDIATDGLLWHHDLTELGNTHRLNDAIGCNVRWVAKQRKWIVFINDRWHWDETGTITRAAWNVIDRMRRETREEEAQASPRPQTEQEQSLAALVSLMGEKFGLGAKSDKPGAERRRWAKASQSRAKIENMVAMLQNEPNITVLPTDLDAQPMRLGTQNGVVNLSTGELDQGAQEDLVTKSTSVYYDPAAQAPRWEQFLTEVLPDTEVRAFVKRALGYSLTGLTREEVFFVLHGSGRNGKSKLLDAFQFMLGDYGQEMPTESLLASKQRGIPNDLARLSGARFVSARETDSGQYLDEARIKLLTGGDRLTARFLNKEFFDFTPTHKQWLATNHLPSVRGTDHAIWSRVLIVPFLQRFAGEDIDHGLLETLKAEAPGILTWAVQGCLEWQRGGLNPPPAVLQAVRAYRAEQDTLSAFIDAQCDVNPSLSIAARSLYAAFQEYAAEHAVPVLTETAFGKRLTNYGYDVRRTSTGNLRMGLALKARDHQ